jgi:hypothetical protein
MPPSRISRLAALVAAIALALAAVASAADAPAPVTKLRASISPGKGHTPPGTPLTLTLDTSFRSVPPGGNFVLQHADYLFANGASTNGRLFPICTVARLVKAHGRLGACPKGSQIGGGIARGTAVALGVTSTAKVTLFNGPHNGLTMNLLVLQPAYINATFASPLVKLHGKYAYKLEVTVPDSLKTILDTDIVVSEIDVKVGATRIVRGVKRGYLEAVHCPKDGKVPLHADFTFNQNAQTSSETTVAC